MSPRSHDIYDVAEKAQVSIATVSRVLNAPERVRDTTRERVLAAIDELRFVPKADASARARKVPGRIAVVAPFFTYPSFTQRLHGVAAALADSAYDLAIYVIDSSARRDSYMGSFALNRRVDGLIVMALPFDDRVARHLQANGVETVLIELGRPPFASIEIDDPAGGGMAARHFLETGHQRCAFVGDGDLPDYAVPTSDWRLQGYRQVLAAAGVPLPDCYIARAPHGLEPGRRLAHQLLDLPVPPTAIFAASDTQALGVLKAARERGIRVPQDLAVIGFDDLPVADYVGLTTIRQPLEESGRLAVDLLLARLVDPSRPPPSVQLPLTLVRRETA